MKDPVIPLNDTHHQALLKLSCLCNTGTDRFYVDRSPRFFALSDYLGKSMYLGIFQGAQLVACIGITEQIRLLHQQPCPVFYLHDLRVHPQYRGQGLSSHLLHAVYNTFTSKTSWMFATILDENYYRPFLTSISSLPISVQKIGRTIHKGFPLAVLNTKETDQGITEISPVEAWHWYKKLACSYSFAPLQKHSFFAPPGYYLKRQVNGTVTSVCKISDQSPYRKVRVATRLSPWMKLFNKVNTLRGYFSLPAAGEIFYHSYLSYYVSLPQYSDQKHYLRYIQNHKNPPFPYVFIGLSEKDAHFYRNPFAISFSSTTYVFGDKTIDFPMDAHELTLI